MASLGNPQPLLEDHHGPAAVELLGQGGLGTDEIHLGLHGKGAEDVFRLAAHMAGESPEDPFHFRLFLQPVFLDVVVQVHHCHGFHEQGGPAGALVMDHPGEVQPVFLFDGDYVPVFPHGHQGILEVFLVVGIVEDIGEFVLHPVLGRQDPGAQALELYGSVVLDVPLFIQGAGQLLAQPGEIPQLGTIIPEGRSVFRVFQQELLQMPEPVDGVSDGLEVFRLQDAPYPGPFHQGTDIRHAPQGQPFPFVQQLDGFGSFLLGQFHLFEPAGAHQVQGQSPAQRSPCLVRQESLHFIEFQCIDSKFPHSISFMLKSGRPGLPPLRYSAIRLLPQKRRETVGAPRRGARHFIICCCP